MEPSMMWWKPFSAMSREYSTRMSSSSLYLPSFSTKTFSFSSKTWFQAETSPGETITSCASHSQNSRLITSRRSPTPTLRCRRTSQDRSVLGAPQTKRMQACTRRCSMRTTRVCLRDLKASSLRSRTSMKRSFSGLKTRCIRSILKSETFIALWRC